MRPGHEQWVTRDYGGDGKALSMSKAQLGLFVFVVLREGGDILGAFAMGPRYPRSYVQMSISLPRGGRDVVERDTGVALEHPPRLSVPVGRKG